MEQIVSRNFYYQSIIGILVSASILTGCSDYRDSDMEKEQQEKWTVEEAIVVETTETDVSSTIPEEPEPKIIEADWSDYFGDLNGAAVVYDAAEKNYWIYNEDLATTQTSPCSTFKIVSSLIGIENGMIEPDHSVRIWSGETFWNEDWNRDIDFSEAFRTSCVWYFRQVVDDIGKELMQRELDNLKYGNCDISDWEGRLNTNNNNRALTGFWLESSLKISPKEQVEVMERIFGVGSVYSEKTQNELRQVMLAPEQSETGITIYGKTGMGKAQCIVVDAWFTGFAEMSEQKVYFCVYLGQTSGENVSSAAAKEIAVRIVNDHSK